MSHSHLTMEERIRIEVFVNEGLSCRKIARHLGRHHTTIARELHRNSSKSGYRARTADHRARKRRKIPRHYRCMSRPGLIAWVDEKLRTDWSPEQIAGRIRLDYPRDPDMRISTETVYHWIYAAAQVGDTSYRDPRINWLSAEDLFCLRDLAHERAVQGGACRFCYTCKLFQCAQPCPDATCTASGRTTPSGQHQSPVSIQIVGQVA